MLTVQAIQERVMNTIQGAAARLSTSSIHAQFSLGGGVLLHVTGVLTYKVLIVIRVS